LFIFIPDNIGSGSAFTHTPASQTAPDTYSFSFQFFSSVSSGVSCRRSAQRPSLKAATKINRPEKKSEIKRIQEGPRVHEGNDDVQVE
jgi:hypothetical protein